MEALKLESFQVDFDGFRGSVLESFRLRHRLDPCRWGAICGGKKRYRFDPEVGLVTDPLGHSRV